MIQTKTKWYLPRLVRGMFGVHIKYFIPIALMVLVAARFNMLPPGFVGMIAILMAAGGLLSWLGSTLPLLREVGGHLLLPLFGSTLLYRTGILPEFAAESSKFLMDGGFQMVFVTAVLVGSILAMDRKMLLASVVRYVPVLIISQLCALACAFLAAMLTGTSLYDAIFFIAAPCMTGGTSGAIATLPALYSQVLGQDVSSIGGTMLAVAMIGTYLATALVIVMRVLADKLPGLMGNGNGQILQRESEALKKARENMATYEDSSADYSQLGAGIFVSAAIMVLGSVLSSVIPQIIYVAMAIIVCIVLKGTGLLPDEICKATHYWSQFAIKNIVVVLATAVGLSSSGGTSLSSVLNAGTIIIILITFIGAIAGAMIGSKLLGLYRYEGALTAAMCACNIGASGDIQMLAIADRLELLAFATISTRIGGALMLIEISIIFPIVCKAMGII
ncbi:MAG: 2-hydroxycarboxylate transporter family protein [Oscillospiraceae bacterium]|nr:2-hydroxycarboxylate transporter family protein [Oscillospiraceae bacterium]